MRSFVTWKNIERYRELLGTESDPARRRTLEKLLAEEEQIWAALQDHHESSEPKQRTA